MVDLSLFFLLLRFLGDWAQKAILPNTVNFLLITAGAILVCLLFAIFIPKKEDGKLAYVKGFFSFAFKFLCFIAALFIFLRYWPDFVQFGSNLVGISETTFQSSAIITITLLGFAALFFGSFICSKEPNNSSLCNRRQALRWSSYLFAIILSGYALYVFNFGLFFKTIWLIFFLSEIISVFFWFYDPIIYFISKIVEKKHKLPYEATPNKLNRFAIIGCAHNEESVIDQLVKSLYATTYPKNKYDIYVICDNCTDSTAEVVRKAGGIPMERVDTERKGKGFALEWMFSYLDEQSEAGNKYDAYIVLDADNIVNAEYLDAINSKMNEGHEILQTYLGCKNPKDTWISACYSYSYWISNALYQEAHAKVGLSAQMGGTGMVIRPSVLADVGWKTDSLTEDLVLTTRYITEKNMSCSWVHNARLYDEKPLKTVPSIRQRTRWMQGHMAAMFQYTPGLILKGINKGSLKSLDMAYYLMRPFLNILLFSVYAFRVFFNVFMPESMAIEFMLSSSTATFLLVQSIALQLFVLFTEQYGRYCWIFLAQVIFSFTWYPAMIRGLIKRKESYWVSTVHTRNISIAEVGEDARLIEAKERLKGIDNLHRLPLGQILLKAMVISKAQLDAALEVQKEHGGFLGDIIVDMNAISAETLESYLSIQDKMKELAQEENLDEEHPRLGEILLNSKLISEMQLEAALDYQRKHGGLLGDCLILTRCLPINLLSIFLDVQQLLDANYISPKMAKQLIEGIMESSSDNLGTILWNGGLISGQQLQYALNVQEKNESKQIGTILVECGFIKQATIDLILNLQKTGRKYLEEKQGMEAK